MDKKEKLSYEAPVLKDAPALETWTKMPIVANGGSGGMDREGKWDNPFA